MDAALSLSSARHVVCTLLDFFFLMIRRPPRSTLDRSSAASDVYKRQLLRAFDDPVEEAVLDGHVLGDVGAGHEPLQALAAKALHQVVFQREEETR